MGGSGGWRYFPRGSYYPPDGIGRETDQAIYDAEVESFLQNLLKAFNDRDVEAINRHLQTIQDALEKEIEGVVKLSFGGSVTKHTYVDGLSDVDMLVCINDTSLSNRSPAEALAYFAQRLSDRLPSTDIHRGDLAVTVAFADGHTIQLLPAVRTGAGYRIARQGGNQWSQVIRPAQFARELTDVNQANNGKAVPVIKLYKALNDSLPKQSSLTGYHIDSLAIEAFREYTGRRTFKYMLHHLCSQVASGVLQPMADKTGQSIHVDAYLGAAGSQARLRVGNAVANISRKIDHANSCTHFAIWEDMFS